jgi:hypothetical protein
VGAAASDFSCHKGFYQAVVKQQGVKAAFTDLKQRFTTNDFIRAQCHQVTHVIGRAAGEQSADVASAYRQGDDFCSSGYYHGVMEAIVGRTGEEALVKSADNICAGVRQGNQKYSLTHHNCTHGMGHGFMALQGDELHASLAMCDYLHDPWERESCLGGVFMENVMASFNSFHNTKYLRADQPMYPCNAVETTYKNSCYFNQTSYALKVVNYDFSKVFSLCKQAEQLYHATCYQSLGRDASGNSQSDITKTRQTCMLGSDYEAQSNCIIGAVKDIIWYNNGIAQGNAFCGTLLTHLQSVCLSTGKEYYKTFTN